jgi:hypothetical protein
MMVRLIYASRSVGPVTAQLHNEILSKAQKYNPAHGVTGILMSNKETFLQILEGGREEVNRLYNAIARDERHTDVCLMLYEDVHERRFENWLMGKVNVGSINPALILKYSPTRELDPYKISGQAILAMVSELVASGAIVSK